MFLKWLAYPFDQLTREIRYSSIYKGKAICFSINKGNYINSISILKYYI